MRVWILALLVVHAAASLQDLEELRSAQESDEQKVVIDVRSAQSSPRKGSMESIMLYDECDITPRLAEHEAFLRQEPSRCKPGYILASVCSFAVFVAAGAMLYLYRSSL